MLTSVGAVVSTKYLGLSATAAEAMVASLPFASVIVAPLRLSALRARATPLLSFWRAATVVVKTKALLPEPETYVACTVLVPITSANVGEPTAVLTVITSSKVTVAERVSVALRLLTVASFVLMSAPVVPVKAKLEMTGASVSKLMLGDKPAAPKLPAAS